MNNGFLNFLADNQICKALEKTHHNKNIDSNKHNNKTINLFYCNEMHATYNYDEYALKCIISLHFSS